MLRKLSFFCCGLILCSNLCAQVTTGITSGIVKDTSGAVIPGVTIAIKNVDTGAARTVTTNAEGRYNAPNLPSGNYEIQAQISGFKTEVRSGIKLTVGQEVIVDFVLTVGQVAERVEVQEEAPLVETTNAAITGLVDDKTIRDLPLNGRSFGDLVLLQVGTNFSRRDQNITVKGGGQRISISGMRPQANSFLLDGTDINGPANQVPGSAAGVSLGVDTVREFRVLTNSYSAEYGRAAGGVITAITRSGTNQFHGSAFEFLRNSKLDARNFFDRGAPPPFKRNQFGFTLGGPIKKDRTFFFGSYEGLRQRLGVTGIATVPDALAHQGIMPQGGVVGAPLVNVGVAPGVQPWLSLYPIPNGPNFGNGTAQYIWTGPQPTDENYFTTRVDHAFSGKHSVFARYTFDDSNRSVPRAFPFDKDVLSERNQFLTIEADSIFTASTLNAFRFGLNRSFPKEQEQNDIIPAGLTLVPGVPFTFGGWLDSTGFSKIGMYLVPDATAYTLFEWSDDITRVQGKHTLKTGFLIKRIRNNTNSQTQGAGHPVIGGGVWDFLQGRSTSFAFEWPGLYRYRQWRQIFFGGYAQDDFKMTPTLTLNLGVREEFMTSPTEIFGKCSNFTDLMQTSTTVGCPPFNTFKNNWMPRVGFAWDTRGNAKLVLRGGFGLFYDQPFPTYWGTGVTGMPPFTVDVSIPNAPFPNAISLINLNSPPANQRGITMRSQKYTGTPYSMQYNFTLQSEITRGTALTVGYMGAQGRHLFRTGQMNTRIPTILPDGTKYFAPNAPYINPAWGNINMQQTDANSNYNAFIMNLSHQFRSGLRVQGSYTFGKTLSEGDTVFGLDFVGGPSSGQDFASLDPYNARRDRGLSGFNLKHNLVVNYSYALPFKRKGAVGKIVEGWQINGISTVSSGMPLSAIAQCCSNNGSTGVYIIERPNLAPGRSNNPVLGNPNKYFDPSAFVPSQPGFYGNLGRSTLIGPGLFTFDFSLVKNTAITERTKLEFRAELFNLLNRANFGSPANMIFDTRATPLPTAGLITSTSTTSRQIQFALKFLF